MKIRFLGQSGYLLQSGQTEIMIDPYLSDSVNRVGGRPRLLPIPLQPQDVHCDAIICTHNHLDHLDPDTVAGIAPAQFYLTTDEGKEALRQQGRTNVRALHAGEEVTVGDFRIHAVFADHTVEAFGVVVEAEGHRAYFSGDTLYNEKLFDIADLRPDVTFICINGRLGNMSTEEALTVARRIGAPVNVPTHYDMFASNSADPQAFAAHIAGGFIMDFDQTYTLDDSGLHA